MPLEPDAASNVSVRSVSVAPLSDGFGIGGKHLDLAEGGVFPITRAEEDGDDASFALAMAFNGAPHFAPVAVIGFDEVGADEEEDDRGGVEVSFDLLLPILTGNDHYVIPACN